MKTLKRTFIKSVIMASSLVMLLAGCGQGASSSITSQQSNKQGPVQIEFWYGNSGVIGDTIKDLTEQFNQSQDEVKVNAVFQESTNNIGKKLLTAIVGNAVPDVVQLNARFWPAFAYNKALLPLDPYIQKDPEFNYGDFVDSFVDNTLIEGKTYTLPFNRSTPILYYNKDIVKEIGLDPEHPVSTWDEMMTAAKKATVLKDGKTERFGYASLLPPLYYYSLMWSNGGDILSLDQKDVVIDQAPAIQGLEMYRKMIYDDKTMMQPLGGNRDGDQEMINFQNGKVAFLLASTGDLNQIQNNVKFKLGVDFVPKFKEYAVPSTSGGNLAIVAKAPKEKQDAAWKFMKFLTDKQQTIYFAQHTGYMPIRKSAVKAPEMVKFYKENPFFKITVDQLPYGKGIPVVPNFEKIETEIQNALGKTYAENVPAQESMKEAADKIRELLKE
ncbi:ABC transporter substrate-binding protein [Paenibacillus sp. Aloe-11]|uniref:ABC transporter substrate-binding protein n=1 Tax=Paenibacillus sp. Aloe-11 TaxID=1050222 RepID=UPI001E366C22|nr:ABC transporter substrate-binding protein [Paenibacillus sp. Aloe-11]